MIKSESGSRRYPSCNHPRGNDSMDGEFHPSHESTGAYMFSTSLASNVKRRSVTSRISRGEEAISCWAIKNNGTKLPKVKRNVRDHIDGSARAHLRQRLPYALQRRQHLLFERCREAWAKRNYIRLRFKSCLLAPT